MARPLLILLSMADSKHHHLDKLRFMVLMVDYYVIMCTSEIKNEEYFLPVTSLEDEENEEGPGDDYSPE